jgi:hypothetical protein
MIMPEISMGAAECDMYERICSIIVGNTMESENLGKLREIWQKILRTIHLGESRAQTEKRFGKLIKDSARNPKRPPAQQSGD